MFYLFLILSIYFTFCLFICLFYYSISIHKFTNNYYFLTVFLLSIIQSIYFSSIYQFLFFSSISFLFKRSLFIYIFLQFSFSSNFSFQTHSSHDLSIYFWFQGLLSMFLLFLTIFFLCSSFNIPLSVPISCNLPPTLLFLIHSLHFFAP